MAYDPASLDAAFAALTAFDWGGDAAAFAPIDAAVIAAHGDAAARADVEKRLTAVLGGGSSRAAKEYACRKLSMIGTAGSVPALADLLADRDNSHMARFALERIAAPEAVAAMRAALGTVAGPLKIGMLSSLASRRDAASVPAIAALLGGDAATAEAAAKALGTIQSADAAAALATAAATASGPLAAVIADARFECAEALLKQNKRAEAAAIYTAVAAAAAGKPHARLIELAATRGLVACADTLAAS